MPIQNLQTTILKQVKQAVKKSFGKTVKDLFLSFPPDIKMGDLTLECFSLGKHLGKNPAEVAQILAAKITKGKIIQEVKAMGPYLNFKLSDAVLFNTVCSEITSQKNNFGRSSFGRKERVMVEYLSPNTNKPLHLGHLRNGSLGMAMANLLTATGHKVIKANLINDRGIHICKSMLAWQKWAKGATPKSTGIKGDHFVGKWYVRYAQEVEKNPDLKNEAQRMLKKWEANDPETIKIWRKMNNWVYQGFKQSYKNFGLKFDLFYYESKTYKLGKSIISQGLKKKIFYRDKQGAVVFQLPEKEITKDPKGKTKEVNAFGLDKDGQPKKITLLRADGTSVYITQDLGIALLKVKENKLTRSIYVVGSEQEYYLKCLFKVLETLGYEWAKKCYHLSYGMVYLPEGKMKSREGKIVDADNLIAEMISLAEKEIKKRDMKNKLSSVIIKKRAEKIGLAAIKFYLLRTNPRQDIHFNPKESISFDGATGPYLQYTYARCHGILRKLRQIKTDQNKIKADFSTLGNLEERLLIKKLLQFPEKVKNSTEQFNPSQLAVHLHETAQAFNQFYHQHPVLSAKNTKLKQARLLLTQAVSIVLKNGLNLLGIEVLEKM